MIGLYKHLESYRTYDIPKVPFILLVITSKQTRNNSHIICLNISTKPQRLILSHFSNVSQQFLITFTCETRKAFVMQNNNFISDFQVQLEVAPRPLPHSSCSFLEACISEMCTRNTNTETAAESQTATETQIQIQIHLHPCGSERPKGN